MKVHCFHGSYCLKQLYLFHASTMYKKYFPGPTYRIIHECPEAQYADVNVRRAAEPVLWLGNGGGGGGGVDTPSYAAIHAGRSAQGRRFCRPHVVTNVQNKSSHITHGITSRVKLSCHLHSLFHVVSETQVVDQLLKTGIFVIQKCLNPAEEKKKEKERERERAREREREQSV